MDALRRQDSGSWFLRFAKRSSFALLPLLTIGGLAVASSPASASTSSALSASSSGSGVNLAPTLAAVEADVSAVLNESVPLIGSIACVPSEVTGLLSGGRVFPC
jgi:hypothetical protein